MVETRAFLLAFGFFQSFLASGIIYGWPGLLLVLKAEGFYGHLCLPPSAMAGGGGSGAGLHLLAAAGCPAQQTALNALFTVAQSALTGAMLVHGVVLDLCGPRITSVTGTCLVLVGSVAFALCDPTADLDLSVVALSTMGVGGAAVHLSWFHISNLFPSRKQTISSIVIAAFVGSGVVFQLWQLAVTSSFGRREIFLSHSVAVALCLPVAARVWPDRPFALGDQLRFTGMSLGYSVTPAAKGGASTAIAAARMAPAEHKMPLRQQLGSPVFWHVMLFFAVQFFRYVWLLGTLLDQMESKGDTTHLYSKIAGWALPCAALGQPVLGLVLDRYGFARGFLSVICCGAMCVTAWPPHLR